jgi:hypothetical protein
MCAVPNMAVFCSSLFIIIIIEAMKLFGKWTGVYFHMRDEFLRHYCTIVGKRYVCVCVCVMCVLGYIENEATTQRDRVIFRHTWVHVTCRKPYELCIFSTERDTITDSDKTCAFARSDCSQEGATNCQPIRLWSVVNISYCVVGRPLYIYAIYLF